MPVKTLWQDLYVASQVSDLTTYPGFTAGSDIGLHGTGAANGIFLLPLTDHPHLKPSTGTVENEMAVGEATRRTLEYNQTISQPGTVTINMLANAYNISLFTYLLLQTGCTEINNSPRVLHGTAYTSPSPEVYMGLIRVLADDMTADGTADTASQIFVGCICTSLTLSGETGGLLTLSAELQAADHAIASSNLDAVAYNTLTFSDKAPLKFQDMTFRLNSAQVDTPSFSITITNGATAQFYNNGTIQRYVLGRVNVEGTFGIPFGDTSVGGNDQITDFKAGTDKRMEAYWGSINGNVDNAVSLSSNVRYTDTEMADAEGEIITSCPFAGVKDADSNSSIYIRAGYDSAQLNRGATVATTTSTTTTSTSTTTTSTSTTTTP